MATINDYTKLREKLLAHIYDEEHSDLPNKIYRISSMEYSEAILPITIRTKSLLGAVIVYADWDMEYSKIPSRYWCDFAKEWNNQDIGEYASVLVNKFCNEEIDENTTEVKELYLSPFTGEDAMNRE